jgi:hypothetical protein
MQPISVYTWRHIRGKLFAMYVAKAVYAKLYDLKIFNRSAYAYDKAATWSNPPLAPPQPYLLLQQVLTHIKYNHMQNYMRVKNRDYHEGKRNNFNRF